MPKAEMRTAKRTARNEPSILFSCSFFSSLSLSLSARALFFFFWRLSLFSLEKFDFKKVLGFQKRKKLGKKRRRGGRLFSGQRGRYNIYTHINRETTSE